MFVRSWYIPEELKSGFFRFWGKNQDLRKQGFSIKEEDGSWVLSEWRRMIRDFSNIGRYPEKKKIMIPTESSLEIIPIKNHSGLREWQPNVVAKLCASIRKYGAAIDGSDLGTGKSYCAVAVAREMGYNVGVVCPKAVVTEWNRVISNHFGMTPLFVINYEGLRTGKHKDIAVWERLSKKTTRTKFKWKIKNPEKTLIIFDESHKLKTWSTQNAEMGYTAKDQGYKILCLSATNSISPIEMRTVGKIIGLHNGSSKEYTNFLTESDCEKGRFGWQFGGDEDVLKKLNFDIFKERGTRIKREEIPSFPSCDLSAEAFDIDDKSKNEMNKIFSEMNSELKSLERTIKSNKEKNQLAMVIQLRARQKCEFLKVPLLVDMAKDAMDNGMSVAIFINFSDTIRSLAEKLDTICIVWGEDVKNRQQHIDDFQSNKSKIILVNIKAGGAGLSLHNLNGNHPRLALISPTNSAVDLKQCTGRVWRTGALTKAVQKIIFISGTEEEVICNKMKTKLHNLDLINDGDLSVSPIFK